MTGGVEKWVNRKMLIPDPKGLLETLEDPLHSLPLIDNENSGALEDSDSESEGELVLVAPSNQSEPLDGAKTTSVTGSGPIKSHTNSKDDAKPSQSERNQVLRRSERLKKKRSGSWPQRCYVDTCTSFMLIQPLKFSHVGLGS